MITVKLSGAAVILSLHALLGRLAEKLCTCTSPGNREADPEEHAQECEYRVSINGDER